MSDKFLCSFLMYSFTCTHTLPETSQCTFKMLKYLGSLHYIYIRNQMDNEGIIKRWNVF